MNLDDQNSVSVVLPCYNGMPFLSEAIESALAQTHRPAQILIVDDGSTDRSPDVARQYAKDYPDRDIQFIQQSNAGEPTARNTGIDVSTGHWVAMLDADDWWKPDKLEKQLAVAAEAGPDCVMVHTGLIHEFTDGRSDPKDFTAAARRTGWCTEALLEPSSIAHPSVMVRRDALTKIGGYDPSFKQACDIDLYFRLSAIGTFAFVPEHLLHYRKHPNQMSAHQVDQIGYHHRAVRKFFSAHPEIEQKIGRERIESALAEHVTVKLESLYWRRRLDEFNDLLEYARSEGFDTDEIRAWERRSKVPDWMIKLKDKFSMGSK